MTANASNQIGKLQEDADQLTRKVELERRHVAELDRQIAEMNATVSLCGSNPRASSSLRPRSC
jgi:hypothetical protein